MGAVGIEIAIVVRSQTGFQIIVPSRVVLVMPTPCSVAEAIRLFAVFEGVVRPKHLLERVIDVLIHIASFVRTEVSFRLFLVVRKRFFNTVPGT